MSPTPLNIAKKGFELWYSRVQIPLDKIFQNQLLESEQAREKTHKSFGRKKLSLMTCKMKHRQRILLEKTIGVFAYLSLLTTLLATSLAIEETYFLNDFKADYLLELVINGSYSVVIYTAPLTVVCFWTRAFIKRGRNL